MAAFDLVSWDGNNIGPGTSYDFGLDAREDVVVQGEVATLTRRSTYPRVEATSRSGRVIVIRGSRGDNAITAAQFRDDVEAWFNTQDNASGVRYLVRVAHDGSTLIRIGCYVAELRYVGLGVDQYIVTLFAPNPDYEANSATTSASNPSSVTNAGNVAVAPIIQLTTSNHVTRRACMAAASAGFGRMAFPVVFALNSTSATATNVFVFVEGVSVPCYVASPGQATSRVWALIDMPNDTSATQVDIIYGGGLTNPLCGTLDDAGMDWDDAVNCHNTQWEWNAPISSSHPARPGAWVPALTGNHNRNSNTSYGSSNGIALGADGVYDNSLDSFLMSMGGGQAGTLSNLSRTTTGLDGVNAQAYVRYRQRNSAVWTTAWSTRANATVTTAIAVSGAEVAVGIENDGATNDPATLVVGGTSVTMTMAAPITVVVGSAENFDYYNGTYEIGGYTLTFEGVMVDDGALVIDCGERTITPASGPFYGSVRFSDPNLWALLEPGSNTITDGLSATDVVVWRGGYS